MASKKIIHLQMSELYPIVRGKAGKSVEFGLKWGINRIDGFVMGFLINNGINASDQRFCIESIREHIQRAKKLGVKNVGIAPTGKAKWEVAEKMSDFCRRTQEKNLHLVQLTICEV